MALITEFGGASSDSYATLVETSDFLAKTFLSAKWLAVADNDTREVLLMTATRNIDGRNWVGSRYFYNQQLEFPRTLSSSFPRGTLLDPQNIEWRDMLKRIKEAVAFQAVYEIDRNSGDVVDHRLAQRQGIRSISQGGGSLNSSLSFGSYADILHPDAASRLRRWRGATRVYRG